MNVSPVRNLARAVFMRAGLSVGRAAHALDGFLPAAIDEPPCGRLFALPTGGRGRGADAAGKPARPAHGGKTDWG